MRTMRNLLLALVIFGGLAATPALAEEHDSLFINLTTDVHQRADMAMMYAKAMLERDHPVTIWLNDKGVFLASRAHAKELASQQKLLAELIAKGAMVIVCPFCAKHYGVSENDLIEGAKVGNPDLTSKLLFKDDTRALSW